MNLAFIALIAYIAFNVALGLFVLYHVIKGDDYRDRKGQPWPMNESQHEEDAPL